VIPVVRIISPVVKRGLKTREGRGFSVDELKAADLNPGEARHLGIPVDTRRSSSYEENVEALRRWAEEAYAEGFRVPKVKQGGKGQRGRANRGLTSSGKKMRGLTKD